MPKVGTVTIDVHRAKVFDELTENVRDLGELLELIPDYVRPKADKIVSRIMARQKAWVTIQTEEGSD